MSHPGRVGVVCRDCLAELQEAVGGLRCPWADHGRNCGKPYDRPPRDEGAAYRRDELGKHR